MVDAGDVALFVSSEVFRRNIDGHGLVGQIGDIGIHIDALVDGTAASHAHASHAAVAAFSTFGSSALGHAALRPLAFLTAAHAFRTLAALSAAHAFRTLAILSAARHHALAVVDALLVVCTHIDGRLFLLDGLAVLIHGRQRIVGAVFAFHPLVDARLDTGGIVQVDGGVDGAAFNGGCISGSVLQGVCICFRF